MKKMCCFLLVAVMILCCFNSALAYTGVTYCDMPIARGNPNTTLDDPYDWSEGDYTAPFNFLEYCHTNAICVPADGVVTLTLEDAYMNFSSTNMPTIDINAYYWNGSTWKDATVSPSSQKVSKNPADYTFTISGISSGDVFYVELVKDEYMGYKFTGSLRISN